MIFRWLCICTCVSASCLKSKCNAQFCYAYDWSLSCSDILSWVPWVHTTSEIRLCICLCKSSRCLSILYIDRNCWFHNCSFETLENLTFTLFVITVVESFWVIKMNALEINHCIAYTLKSTSVWISLGCCGKYLRFEAGVWRWLYSGTKKHIMTCHNLINTLTSFLIVELYQWLPSFSSRWPYQLVSSEPRSLKIVRCRLYHRWF